VLGKDADDFKLDYNLYKVSFKFFVMTSQELQKQALQLPFSDRWQLVQTLLESLKRQSQPSVKRGNLSSLRGIAKSSAVSDELDAKEDYINYLIKKTLI
jgi:hypothetical protein